MRLGKAWEQGYVMVSFPVLTEANENALLAESNTHPSLESASCIVSPVNREKGSIGIYHT